MNISKDALLRIVKATRGAKALAEIIGGEDTLAEAIEGHLYDALYLMSGERLTANQDFSTDSKVMKLINGDEDCLIVTEKIIRMADENFSWMPRPVTGTKQEMRDMYRANGGYMTPEGDWT